MAFLDIALVSASAKQLEAALREGLPENTRLCTSTGDEAPRADVLNAEVAIGAPDVLAPLLANMPNLRWVQSTWAGVEPFFASPRRDYVLTGVKDIFGASMSEYVLGWLLALKRHIITRATEPRWLNIPESGLAELRVGIAGVGSIGTFVAQRLAPFVGEVRGLNRDGRLVPGCSACFSEAQRKEFAHQLDVLVLVLPATSQTNGLIDAGVIEQLAHGAVLINGGRANALTLPDAVAALEAGALSALVLDVFEKEPLADDDALWSTPGVYISSHSAAPTSMNAVAGVFLDNLAKYQAGTTLRGRIDFTRGY